MKKKNIPVEFVYQLFALIIAIIIVHAFYVSVVRPNAAEVIAEQNMLAEQDPDYVRERSVWVLVKDFEQVVDEQKAEEDAKKLLSGDFTFDHFLEQIRTIKKMGSLKSIIGMMPGMPKELKGAKIDDDDFYGPAHIEDGVHALERHRRAGHGRPDDGKSGPREARNPRGQVEQSECADRASRRAGGEGIDRFAPGAGEGGRSPRAGPCRGCSSARSR